MAGWEEELAALLAELGVTQEEPKTQLRPTRQSEAKLQKFPSRHEIKRREKAADALFWPRNIEGDLEADEETEESWLSDLSLMRREVDSIVNQVMRLMQRGDIDKSLKEDIAVVLRALRLRATVTQLAANSDEAHLEYAAAMLHFCRLVLHVSELPGEDA